jgi:hypothetical protein
MVDDRTSGGWNREDTLEGQAQPPEFHHVGDFNAIALSR